MSSSSMNVREALTLLYLQSQDLKTYTPEQLVDAYCEAYEKIEKSFKGNRGPGTRPVDIDY